MYNYCFDILTGTGFDSWLQLLKGGSGLIKLTGLNHKEFILNAEKIEKIEQVPETMITLVNGKKYLVLQSLEEVLDKVFKYKRKIYTLDIKE